MRYAWMTIALALAPCFAWSQQPADVDLLQQSTGAGHGKGKPMATDPTEKVHGKFNKGKHEKLTQEEKAQLRQLVKERGYWQKEYLDKLSGGDKQALKAFRQQMLEQRRAKLAPLTPEQRATLKADRKVSVEAARAVVLEKYGKDGQLTPEGRAQLRQDVETRRAALLMVAGKGPDGVIEPADRDPAKIRKNAKVFLLKKYHKLGKDEPEPGSPGYEDLSFTAAEEAVIREAIANRTVWK